MYTSRADQRKKAKVDKDEAEKAKSKDDTNMPPPPQPKFDYFWKLDSQVAAKADDPSPEKKYVIFFTPGQVGPEPMTRTRSGSTGSSLAPDPRKRKKDEGDAPVLQSYGHYFIEQRYFNRLQDWQSEEIATLVDKKYTNEIVRARNEKGELYALPRDLVGDIPVRDSSLSDDDRVEKKKVALSQAFIRNSQSGTTKMATDAFTRDGRFSFWKFNAPDETGLTTFSPRLAQATPDVKTESFVRLAKEAVGILAITTEVPNHTQIHISEEIMRQLKEGIYDYEGNLNMKCTRTAAGGRHWMDIPQTAVDNPGLWSTAWIKSVAKPEGWGSRFRNAGPMKLLLVITPSGKQIGLDVPKMKAMKQKILDDAKVKLKQDAEIVLEGTAEAEQQKKTYSILVCPHTVQSCGSLNFGSFRFRRSGITRPGSSQASWPIFSKPILVIHCRKAIKEIN